MSRTPLSLDGRDSPGSWRAVCARGAGSAALGGTSGYAQHGRLPPLDATSAKPNRRRTRATGDIATSAVPEAVTPPEEEVPGGPGVDQELDVVLHRELLEAAQRASRQPVVELSEVSPGWWTAMTRLPIREAQAREPLSLDTTITRALQYSHQIRVFSELPLIRETAIVEAADARFDWNDFVETRWYDSSNPVGSVGDGQPWRHAIPRPAVDGSGGRRRLTTSGAWEIAQHLGYQDNNSIYFVPAL
ncbi:MAG: hypothetical protein U0935_19020 [Pirellulales bacterium]